MLAFKKCKINRVVVTFSYCPFQVVLALICPLLIHKIVFYDEENHKWSVPLWKKLMIFYNAPISKFWAHLVSMKDSASIFLFFPTIALVGISTEYPGSFLIPQYCIVHPYCARFLRH